MNFKNTKIIIAREYLERVKKKSFILTTLLMPLLMILLSMAPTLVMVFAEDDTHTFNVIDDSGIVAPQLVSDDAISYRLLVGISKEDALADKSADGLIYIPADVVSGSGAVKIFTSDGLSLENQEIIAGGINKAIEHERLKEYNIDNIDAIMAAVESNVPIQSVKYDENAGESQESSLLSFIIGLLFTFILYIALMLYGQMVMTSIIEEKNNRVLELVVSSVKPFDLLLGKISGIGLVAVTQIAIWLVLMVSASALLIPAILPTDMMSEINALNSGADTVAVTGNLELLQALSILADPLYILQIFLYLLIFLVLGFLLYAAMYAAIGSAVDNIQDASQLQSLVIVPIILGIVFGMQAASAPNSTLAQIMSLIPFTSPMVMLARIPFGVPAWEIALSMVLLVLGIIFMIWLAGKIYRVGIFMYGKRPTLRELVRWARYK